MIKFIILYNLLNIDNKNQVFGNYSTKEFYSPLKILGIIDGSYGLRYFFSRRIISQIKDINKMSIS